MKTPEQLALQALFDLAIMLKAGRLAEIKRIDGEYHVDIVDVDTRFYDKIVCSGKGTTITDALIDAALNYKDEK